MTIAPGQQVFRRCLSDARYAARDAARAIAIERQGRRRRSLAKSDMTKFDAARAAASGACSPIWPPTARRRCTARSCSRRISIRRRSSRRWSPVYGGPGSASTCQPRTSRRQPRRPSTASSCVTSARAPRPAWGKHVLDCDLSEARRDRDRRHGRRHQGACATRPYFDKTRVGIYGTSYGGYTSASDAPAVSGVVAAASASSPVTTGTTTTRSTPSATCGLRRRTRKATRPATPMNYAETCKGACSSTTARPTTTCIRTTRCS